MINQSAYISGNRISLIVNRLGWAASIDIRKKLYFLTVLKPQETIILDFSKVRKVYPNGIVPIVAEVSRLKRKGFRFLVIPADNEDVNSLFLRNGWYHFIEPEKYDLPKSDGIRSLALHMFSSDEEFNWYLQMEFHRLLNGH